MSVMKATLVLTALVVSGCVFDRGTTPQAGSSSAQAQREDEAYRARQRCQSTMEGNEPKTICY